jgi:hypothetical protein
VFYFFKNFELSAKYSVTLLNKEDLVEFNTQRFSLT